MCMPQRGKKNTRTASGKIKYHFPCIINRKKKKRPEYSYSCTKEQTCDINSFIFKTEGKKPHLKTLKDMATLSKR